MVSIDHIVSIYSSGKYVHKNTRLALTWQEKKTELCRKSFEEKGTHVAGVNYEEALRKLGDLHMKEGHKKRAKQYYRKADQLSEDSH